jgi:hypothetical protein
MLPAAQRDLAPFDARVRSDLGVPATAPQPKLVLLDAAALASLPVEYQNVLRASGGGLYDPNTQTIYLDASRYRDGLLYHELAHHYLRFLSEPQRSECLARLYEVHASRNSSFTGCAP